MAEKTSDITNTDFVKGVCDAEQKMIKGIEERVIFKKKTDDEAMQEEIAALQEHENEKNLKDAN